MKARLLIFSLLLPIFLFPQSSKINKYSSGFGLYWLGIGFTSYDNEIAEQDGFKETTIPIEFGFDLFFKNYFTVGGNSVLEFPKDLEPFYNTVTGGSSVESNVTIPQLALFAGLRAKSFGKTNKWTTGKILIGNNWVINARRAIDGCANCTKQDLNLSSGLYIEPEIDYEYFFGGDFPGSVGISLGYKYFFSGDIKYSIILSTFYRIRYE